MALHSINHCQSENTGNIEASEEIAVSDKPIKLSRLTVHVCPQMAGVARAETRAVVRPAGEPEVRGQEENHQG